MKLGRTRIVADLIAIVSVLAIGASAATYTWDGTTNHWNSPHWLPGAVAWPGDSHHMVINNGFVLLADSGEYWPQAVTINSGTLKITGLGRLFPGADAGTRVLTVNTNGTLELDTWFKADSESLGRLNPDAGLIVVNGGLIRMNGVTGYGRGVTINSGGATFEAAFGSDWLMNNLTDHNSFVFNGNPELIFTGAGVGRCDKTISGGGNVMKRGPGKWTLSRANTYTGDTLVEEGILVLRDSFLADGSTVSIANGAILSLRHYEGDVIGSLILGGVTMPPGSYNRSTHPTYISGSGSLIIGGTSTTSAPSLSWFYGSGGDATIREQITNSMNFAVSQYNAYAYLHRSVRADYNAGVPTAQANYDGPITFGGSRNGRVAMHEMGHVFGVGTRGEWAANLSGGIWTGPNGTRLIRQIDGPGAVINSDGTHFWPYGLNFDNEGGTRNEICHVRLVEAFTQDMGLFAGISTISSISDRIIPAGGTTGPIGFTVGDPGVSDALLVVHAASSKPALVPTNRMTIGGSGANRTIAITPTPGLSGVTLITLTVGGGRDAALTSFVLTVGNNNYVWNGASGSWDTFSPSWNNGTTAWPSLGANHNAVFGGLSGVVSVLGVVRVDDIAFTTSGYVLTNGTLRFDQTPVLTVNNGMTATIASALDGPPGLTKEGAGTLILSGDSPYTGGIYINRGTLLIHGNVEESALVEARNGSVLGGSGFLPATTIRAGAEFSPGPQPGPGLHLESLTLEAGSTLTIDLDPVADHVSVSGDVVFDGALVIRATGALANGVYTVLTYHGTRSGRGLTLGTVPPGYSMAIDESVPGQVRLRVAGGLQRTTLIASDSVWKYNAGGTNLGVAWRMPGYNDSTWPSGPAQLGYGDDDEATAISTANGKPQILYCRGAFSLSSENLASMSYAVLSLLRDDGAVVYLNGVECRRDNFPPPPVVIAFDTPAFPAVVDEDEDAFFTSTVDVGLFNVGNNVIAVEIHQTDPVSSDLSFALALEAASSGSGAENRYVPVTLVSTGAVWKYFAQTNDLGTAWRDNAFDDATWSSGPAMLGFGDANGILPVTMVASNRQWTTYFRRAFLVPNPAQVELLRARLLRDDAAVVYLNGAEIWRDPNLPSTGAILYNTPAVAGLGGADESAWLAFFPSVTGLQPGTNVIAVEVHQNATTSSDLALDFKLTGTLLLPLDARLSISGTTLSWPAEAGWFSIFTTTNLTPPVSWTPVTSGSYFSGGVWHLDLPRATDATRFYKLRGPRED